VKKLLWLTQPKPFDLPRALFRDQDVCRQIDKRRVPAWKKPTGAPEAERQQICFGGQAVVVERCPAIGDVDVVADMAGRRLDPPGVKAEIGVSFEKSVGEHLAGAIRKEMAVGPMPSPRRIVLEIDLRKEHRTAI